MSGGLIITPLYLTKHALDIRLTNWREYYLSADTKLERELIHFVSSLYKMFYPQKVSKQL